MSVSGRLRNQYAIWARRAAAPHLAELGAVDAESNTIQARGTALLCAHSPWTELPKNIPEAIALAAFDVAGAPPRVKARTRAGMRVVIVGAGNSGDFPKFGIGTFYAWASTGDRSGCRINLYADPNGRRVEPVEAGCPEYDGRHSFAVPFGALGVGKPAGFLRTYHGAYAEGGS
jgi:hypothetical protein